MTFFNFKIIKDESRIQFLHLILNLKLRCKPTITLNLKSQIIVEGQTPSDLTNTFNI